MPIKPVNRMDPLPVERPEDVAALVGLLPRARDDSQLRRGLGDHFSYLAAVHPEWFAPYREVVLTELLDGFSGNFGDFCALLHGAPDPCVEQLARRLHGGWDTTAGWALAAIGTEAGLAAVAAHVRADGEVRGHYEELGVWVPPDGPAQYRFSPHRLAVFRRWVDDQAALDGEAHPVGLPLDRVVADPNGTPVTWHYVSLRLSDVPGLPDWPAERVHLVSPRANWDWTLTAGIDRQGHYRDVTAEIDDPPDEEDVEYFRHEEESGGGYGAVDLRPYDADLVYCNGHIQLTPDVVGTAGGPPLGIYANPHCRSCGRLQFHVVSVEHHVRDYGDGWRSLFLCAECGLVTCNGTGWN
jgi:hypothetical protein